MLPRLKRFAEVLIGERDEGIALLGRAMQVMLAEGHRYQRGTPFDRWAFGEVYRLWLRELREQADPMRRAIRTDDRFQALIVEDQDETPDPLTVSFIANLPPQQRSTLLLIYGEGFSLEDASAVLDCPVDTVAARLVRASAGLADSLQHDEGGEEGGLSADDASPGMSHEAVPPGEDGRVVLLASEAS